MNKYIEIKLKDKKVQAINYLKGFSIFTIALMHLIQMMPSMPSGVKTISSIGGTGVHVFFLCSGIGLYLSYLNHKTSFIEFMKKRFFKIYVPYIIIVLISFLLPWTYDGNDRLIALLSHIFLFKMFIPKYESSFGDQFWFVSTIIQLYLLFIPMCYLKNKIKSNHLFISIFIIISISWWIICYLLGYNDIRTWSSFCFQYIWEFALGIVIAKLLYDGKVFKIKNYVLIITTILGIGIQSVMALSSETLKLFNDIPGLIGYLSLALLFMNIPIFKFMINKLSIFSYEFYLIHMLIFGTLFYLININNLIVQCFIGIISLIISVIISIIYNKFVNKIIYNKKY